MPESNLLKEYDGQIIIDFNHPDSSGSSLFIRWQESHPGKPCYIIPSHVFLNSQIFCEKLFSANDHIRIYIVFHSYTGIEFFGNKKTDIIKYDSFALHLFKFFGKQSVIIDLNGCSAGRGSKKSPLTKTYKSLAANLHKSLFNLSGRDIPVIARTSTVIVWRANHNTTLRGFFDKKIQPGRKQTVNIESKEPEAYEDKISISKQPGAKIMFGIQHTKNQIKRDGNIYSWKRKVHRELTVLSHFAKQKNSAIPFFQYWLDALDTQGVKNIQEYLFANKEMFYALYRERNQICSLSFLFQNNPIDQLITEGKKLLDSQHTMHRSVFVQKLTS